MKHAKPYFMTIQIFTGMLIHFFKISIRNLHRHKLTSFINISGLAVGMACTILILLWVSQQLNYDKGQSKKDRIYRLENQTWVVMPPYLGETVSVFPEVENVVRFYFWYEPPIRYEENIFTVTNFALVDSTVFKTFNFNFLAGDPESALVAPFSIVLTESTSKKLFGDEYAIGNSILLDNEYEYEVTGVIEDVKKFHMDINAFASVNDIVRMSGNNDFLTARNHNFSIYLLLHPGVNVTGLTEKINDRARNEFNYNSSDLLLRPFKDIYFAKNLQHENNTKHGNMNLIIAFSIIAMLILLIACVNFINLTIAEASTREKEIAVRKSSGADKQSIQFQFFGETLVTVTIAFLISILITDLILPSFNLLTAESIQLTSMDPDLIVILAGIYISTAILSGLYPSLYLAALKPALLLKGSSKKGGKGSLLSKILITFQFSIAIFLIIAVLSVMRQLNYVQTKDLGINHKQVLTCTLQGEKFEGEKENVLISKDALSQSLVAHNSIQGVTFLHQIPGKITNTWSWYTTDQNNRTPLKIINADPNFIKLVGLEIINGRDFSFENEADQGSGFIINEEAVKQLGIENPIGAKVNDGNIQIIGIVKDFHFNSLHTQIEPMAISWNHWTETACIKFSGNDLDEILLHIEQVYDEFCPGYAFEYDFLDENFARQYKAENQLQTLLRYFVAIAIILSCLGLFALSAFIAKQKTKEIGIRKVFGSTNNEIIILVSKGFLKWVLLANIIAWPFAYIVIEGWLKGFPYRIPISIPIFIFSGIIVILVAIFTVGYQAVKASYTNPIDSLRYE
ncbi:ABC transporter permease [Bacteroidota bacterium]